ncbi:MAG: purine-nucleoside phosphorylase [Acidobacteria bacterium]|nr:purine-nucleoside phosphorylase [Acidobacteriota bacterium]
MNTELTETVNYIRPHCRRPPALGLILGSGLGAYADSFSDSKVLPFSDIPHFPYSTVSGHPGNLVIGSVEGVPCIALQGRIHFYEGYSMQEITFPVRLLGCLGIRSLIVTNAAGGLNPDFRPGDLMLIADHINLMGSNPLIGPNPGIGPDLDEPGPRFPDMSTAYDAGMQDIARDVAGRLGIPIRRGVYLGVTGPSYETPAEIRMCRTLGADAVGMSTVPEVIVAAHMGIPVLGISCIANMAAGMESRKITHSDVLKTTKETEEKFRLLLTGIIKTVGSC